MNSPLLFLAGAVLLLTGCRDFVVNPEPGPSVAPPPELPSVQLKGANTVYLNESYTYKAQDIANARYEWYVQGPAGFGAEGDGTRFYRGVARDTGRALVRVVVLDGAGEPSGFAEREVAVVSKP